jgi:hypothetical protein
VVVEGDLSTERQRRQAPGAARGWLVMRLGLLAVVLGLAATVAVVGRAPGQLDQLTGALAAHSLGEITVIGVGLPAGATGCVTQQVVWRHHGLLRHVHLVVKHVTWWAARSAATRRSARR